MADPLKSAVVTGASSGIGRASALTLDSRGWRVFAGVRRDADAQALRDLASERLTPLLLDVTSHESVAAAAKTIESMLGSSSGGGGLDGLVNNAGVSLSGPLEFIPLDDLRQQLEVNVVGQIAVTQSLLGALRRGRGRIVFIGSMGGYVSNPFQGPYSASKYALEALNDSLRRELAGWGIEVSIVQPGSIATEIWRKGTAQARDSLARLPDEGRTLYGAMGERMLEAVDQTIGRAIPPEKVADAVAHALTARRPRTRYRVGTDAKLVRALSWLLPDRAMDAFLMRVSGLHRVQREMRRARDRR